MQITLKNIQIINAFNSASEIMQVKGVPIKTSWNITKNIKKIEKAFKIYAELEQKLIQEYALKDDDGKIKVDNNNQPKFPPRSEYYSKQAELLECEDTFELMAIKIDDLESCNISPATLYNLEFMIEE